MLQRRLVLVALLSSLTSCVTPIRWKQEGKTDEDEKQANDQCRAKASKECHDGSPYCVTEAYDECMRNRGWHKRR